MISNFWTTCLLFLAGVATFAWLAALMHEKGLRPARHARDLARKLPRLDGAILGALALALWLVAGGKPDGGGANAVQMAMPPGGTNAAQMVAAPSGWLWPMAGGVLGDGLRPAAACGILSQGLRGDGLAAGALLPPPGAVTNADWLANGAHEDWFCLCPSNWWARAADGGWVEFVRVFSSGGFQAVGASGDVRDFPLPFPETISLAPAANWGMLTGGGESLFWHAATPSNTLVLTWQDALRARSHTNLVSFQAELLNDGSVACRHGGAGAWTDGHVAPFVLPFDRDGDGLENSVDPDPETAGPDAHGTNAEWYNVVCSNVLSAADGPDGAVLTWKEGVNSNAYYFVDVVAAHGPAPIWFVGDRKSRLGDPAVVALAGATNRVPLLIGVEYAVTSDTPFSVSIPECYMYPKVTTNGPCAAHVRWPLDINFTETVNGQIRHYTANVTPFDPGGTFTWNHSHNTDCGCLFIDGNVVRFSCMPHEFGSEESCTNMCNASGTYGFEGASFRFVAGECRCEYNDPPVDKWRSVDSGSGGILSFFVEFSEKEVIFEEAYLNAPGDWRPKRSTRVLLTLVACGGPRGGNLVLDTQNLERLMPVGSGPLLLPPSRMIQPGEKFCRQFLCEGETASDSAYDVTVSGTFTENETGMEISSDTKVAVVRILLTPVVHPPKEGTLGRHKYGVCELVEYKQFPSYPAVTWNPVGGGSNVITRSKKTCYHFPLYACENPLRVELGGVVYVPRLSCIEPSGIVAGKVDLCTYGLPPGKAGGIGLRQQMYVTPLTVSFSGIAVEEVPCDQSSVEGYFRYETSTNLWSHTRDAGAGKWLDVDVHNCVGGVLNDVRDVAALSGELLPMTSDGTLTNDYSCGWMDGLMVWQVPSGWNALGTKGETEPFKIFGTVTQEFYIDRWGQASVQKFGNRATRLLNGRLFLNSREIK